MTLTINRDRANVIKESVKNVSTQDEMTAKTEQYTNTDVLFVPSEPPNWSTMIIPGVSNPVFCEVKMRRHKSVHIVFFYMLPTEVISPDQTKLVGKITLPRR